MANRRPVSALEIKQEVEGYSSMNEDAFARRFYADRAELESLGIALKVDRPSEGFLESELYALPPENYYLPAIEFTDGELAALGTALTLLDRPIRLRRAPEARPPATLLGSQQPATQRRGGADRDGDDRLGRGPRALAATGQDRDGDLATQDDHLQLLHDGARRDRRPQGRPLPPRLPLRPVLSDRLLARARRRPRLPALADPGQGQLRDQGRARLHDPRGLRSARLRLASRLADGVPLRPREDLPQRSDRLARRARVRQLRRDSRRRVHRPRTRSRVDLRDRLRVLASARRLAARLAKPRRRARALRVGERGR